MDEYNFAFDGLMQEKQLRQFISDWQVLCKSEDYFLMPELEIRTTFVQWRMPPFAFFQILSVAVHRLT